MKTFKNVKMLLLFLAFAGLTAACSSDDDNNDLIAESTIQNIKVGDDGSGFSYIGTNLHLEADIEAEGLIESIQVTIHSKNRDEEGWKLSKTWTTEYKDVKNTVFHEHVPIPKDVEPGEYHVRFYVMDQQGNTTEEEVDIEIKDLFELEDLTYGSKDVRDDKIANVGLKGAVDSRLYIAANLKSVFKLTSIKIDLIPEEEDSKKEVEFEQIDATDHYDPKTEEFEISIFIPEMLSSHTGPYKLRITLANEEGDERVIDNEVKVTTQPFIEDFELGSGHGAGERTDHIGYIGRDIHQEGKIYTIFNRMESIEVEIIQDVEENPRTIRETYDKDSGYFGAVVGVRNDVFHEHIDIPKDMPEGRYNYSIRVTDMKGLSYQRNLILELKKPL